MYDAPHASTSPRLTELAPPTPTTAHDSSLRRAIWRSAAMFLLVFTLIALVMAPDLRGDPAIGAGVLLQTVMTALCVGGWFSLMLVFDGFIGESH